MSSKLDYLKKYTGGSGGEHDETKKKRKKTKPSSSSSHQLKVVDEEADFLKALPPALTKKDPSETTSFWDVGRDDDEDGPTIVMETAEVRPVSRGTWTTVDEDAERGETKPFSSSSSSSGSSSGVQYATSGKRRHDSSDEDDVPPRRRRPGTSSAGDDDDDDASIPRRPIANTAKSVAWSGSGSGSGDGGGRRRRHDSDDDDESPPRRPPVVAITTGDGGARGGGSGGGDGDLKHAAAGRGGKRDGDGRGGVGGLDGGDGDNGREARGRGRVRHDSDDDDAGVQRRPKREEEDDEDVPRRRKRADSDDKEPPRRPSNGGAGPSTEGSNSIGGGSKGGRTVGDGDAEVKRRTKTASGHDAGLQSASSFGLTEMELKKKRDAELSGVDPSLLGADSETVYRDRKGKKLDMLNEFMRQQAIREGKQVKLERAQYEWGRGTVQKQEQLAAQKELEEIAAEPFARTAENPRLEAMRKDVIRDGDPMAEYILKKKEKEAERIGGGGAGGGACAGAGGEYVGPPKKPKYKGPLGPANRFGILPGYRWDGIDRGNKYEHKVLTRANDRAALKEDEYKWSVAEM